MEQPRRTPPIPKRRKHTLLSPPSPSPPYNTRSASQKMKAPPFPKRRKHTLLSPPSPSPPYNTRSASQKMKAPPFPKRRKHTLLSPPSPSPPYNTRSASQKMKAPPSSTAEVHPNIEAPPSSTAAEVRPNGFPSLNPLTQGDKPYSVIDLIYSHNPSPLRFIHYLQRINHRCNISIKGGIKNIKMLPDSRIIDIVKDSISLKLPFSPSATPARVRKPTFPDMTAVTGKLIYRNDDNGYVIDCSEFLYNWIYVPMNSKSIVNLKTTEDDPALFILLVSDDYVFMSLAHSLFHKRFPCIVVTTQGQPDFLIKLERELKLPILALLDCDARSLKLLAYYGRILKNIKWLGIRPTDVAVQEPSVRACPMTARDIKTVNVLLEDDYFKKRPAWLSELHFMLKNQKNVAIASLRKWGIVHCLTEVFLPVKLQMEDWI